VGRTDTFAVADRLRYDCELAQLPERLAARFVQLAPNERTHEFLRQAQALRHSRLVTPLQGLLCRMVSDFDANALHALKVERLARVPYLSVGDSRRPLYVLDSVLLVCEPA
jgi:hypothetical protein